MISRLDVFPGFWTPNRVDAAIRFYAGQHDAQIPRCDGEVLDVATDRVSPTELTYLLATTPRDFLAAHTALFSEFVETVSP